MAYTVAQTYAYEEFQHGTTTLRFVISNDYNALYNEEVDIETDIFMLDSVAEDLNLEQGSFAVDEIQFSADAAACQSTDDERAIAFALGCTDVTKNRFCALFINPTFTAGVVDIGTKKFVGKMVTKVGAEDTGWEGASQYSDDTMPIRNWKFSALSFDISVLEQVKMDMFYLGYFSSGNTSETPDIAAITSGTIDALFEHKPYYAALDYTAVIGSACRVAAHVRNLGNLKEILQTYLDHAALIIEHIITGSVGMTPLFTFELLDSDLGIGVMPAKYKLETLTSFAMDFSVSEVNVYNEVIPLTISDDVATTVYVHKGMMKPVVKYKEDGSESGRESEFSFRSAETISDLLFKIGACFSCYVRFEFVSMNHLTIKFVSRAGLLADSFTYVQDSTKATLDMSSNFAEKNQKVFIGRSSNWAMDMDDAFSFQTDYPPNTSNGLYTKGDAIPSEKLTQSRQTANAKVRETERLLLTTSFTRNKYYDYDYRRDSRPLRAVYPQNTIFIGISGTVEGDEVEVSKYLKEFLHTAIYVRRTAVDFDEIFDLGAEHVWQPAMFIVVKENGLDVTFNSLVAYANHSMQRDGIYYESERSMSVPFWSGFSASSDGSSPDWRNIKLGSKIKQVEHKLVLNEATNAWTTADVTDEYVVVGMKTNLKEPGVDLKLHRTARFAYGTWTGDADAIDSPYISNAIAALDSGDNQPQTKGYICGEDITQYYAVTVQVDETIIHSRSIASHYRKIVGIALETKLETELCLVQIGGRCIIPTASFEAGKPVFVRTGTWNVTQDGLIAATAEENLYFKIGKADGPNSFIFDIEQYKFNNTALI